MLRASPALASSSRRWSRREPSISHHALSLTSPSAVPRPCGAVGLPRSLAFATSACLLTSGSCRPSAPWARTLTLLMWLVCACISAQTGPLTPGACSPPPPDVATASSMFEDATGRRRTTSRIGSSPCPGPLSALAPLVPLAPQAPLPSPSIRTPTPSALAVVPPLRAACRVAAAPATSTGPPILPQVPALARLEAMAEARW